MQETQENSDTKCLEETRETRDCGETGEATEDVKKNEEKEEEESEEETSPRGVLEINISDNSSNLSSSGSFGSLSFNEEQQQRVAEGQGMQWKGLLSEIKRRSVRRLSVIPMLSLPGSDNWKSLRKRLVRNRSAEEEIDCGDLMVPKPSWRNFSLRELAAATDDFSPDNLIGKGGHARVYKGCLPDGQIVAVKRITKEQKSDEDRVGDFLAELGIIAHISHPNAAKLIGFGIDGGLHLVLQFLPHGSLATVLHGSNKSPEWKIRFKVANGVAEGLRYLHCECQRRIIHRDITASNILLTEDYEPQISDFGLAKWLPEKWIQHVVFPIEGTFGYMAPEYFMHGIVDEKTDVFAFGVLLLELMTGRRAVNSFRQSLVMWAKPLLEKNDVKELVDPLLQDAYDSIEMKRAMLAASICLHHVPSMRPNMKRVVSILKGEGGAGVEMKQKSMGLGAIMLDAYDLEDYTNTTYLKDLNRHMQLVME